MKIFGLAANTLKVSRNLGFCVAVSTGLAWSAQSVRADEVSASFDTPVYAGILLNCNGPGTTCSQDNTSTAGPSLIIGPGGYLQWGVTDGDPVGIPDTYSSLTFSADSIGAPVAGTTEQIGTLTFLNGTSSTDSIIFGANLNLSLDGFAGTYQILINTTVNQFTGTGLTQAQLEEDADYVNVCGPESGICGTAIQAFEDSEGGTGFTVDLCGKFGRDGQISLVQVCGSSGGGNTVPEPAPLGLLGAALVGLGALGFRRRKTNKAV